MMSVQTILSVTFYVVALAAALTVGRSNIKKQTISDQSNLITVLQQQNEHQAKQIETLEKRIDWLEGMLGDSSQVVYPRDLAGNNRGRRRNGAAPSQDSKDG